MRSWLILPALALSALGALVLQGDGALRSDAQPHLVRLAALQTTDTLSDACVWSPEAAAAGELGPCAAAEPNLGALKTDTPPEAPEIAAAARRPLVWPDDFIALTVNAATDAWSVTVGFLADLYDYAFGADEPEEASGT